MACSDRESGAISPPLLQYMITVFQHQSCHHIHTAVERRILDLAVLPLHDIYVPVRSDENSGGCGSYQCRYCLRIPLLCAHCALQ